MQEAPHEIARCVGVAVQRTLRLAVAPRGNDGSASGLSDVVEDRIGVIGLAADHDHRGVGEEGARPARAVVDFIATVGIGRIDGWYVDTEVPVTESVAYDEEAAIRRWAEVDGATATLSRPTAGTPIEIVTALAVHLHDAVSPPPEGMKWLDTRLELRRPLGPTATWPMRLSLERQIGDRLTRSGIWIAEEDLGHIFFSLGQP